MIERFQVISERLPRNRDALLNDQRRFDGGQSIPLDRVRAVRNFQVVIMLKVAQCFGRQGTQPLEPVPLRGDGNEQLLRNVWELVEMLPPLCGNKQSGVPALRPTWARDSPAVYVGSNRNS